MCNNKLYNHSVKVVYSSQNTCFMDWMDEHNPRMKGGVVKYTGTKRPVCLHAKLSKIQ